MTPVDGVAAIVVAAGTGERYGRPKQFDMLAGRRILDWSIEAAATVAAEVVVVVPEESVANEAAAELVSQLGASVVAGGTTRAGSVRAGLQAVSATASIVVVHDAARPLATQALFESVVAAVAAVAGSADGAVPGIAVHDTLKSVAEGAIVGTVDREGMVAVQTPQAFRAGVLRRAHRGEPEATDDAGLVEALGGRVVVVPGEGWNLKLTGAQDLVLLEALLAARSASPGTVEASA